jgi:hypothetical protein
VDTGDFFPWGKTARALTWMWPVLMRQAIYVLRNTKARSLNHLCCRKTINITYSWCLCVALVKQQALYYVAVCGLSACTVFFPHYLINAAIFLKKKRVTENTRTSNFCINCV